MVRKSGWLTLAMAVAVAFGLGRVSADGIPSGAFVRDSGGQDWLMVSGQRSRVPIYAATDEQISAFPDTGKWIVPTGDGQGVMLGDKPAWAPGGSTSSSTSGTAPGADKPPTVSVQLSDDRIDPGQKITVTVIGSDDIGLNRIEFEGTVIKNSDDNDNRATGDPELDGDYKFDCDGRKDCANIWTIAPAKPGRFTIRARARDTSDQKSEWVKTEIRVREGPTPTPTATATAKPTNTVVPSPAR